MGGMFVLKVYIKLSYEHHNLKAKTLIRVKQRNYIGLYTYT